ncbi:hypothetical protein [Maribacter arcticus]|uniref:Lipocalin-like domain-containing protein n=1 Tax=Maribacter arcticus TaxID=561365 RepID=A0A1T5A833_9FLAO|nr:hypothetical protein [Maribacter arcticus]SKB31075.1 hypothetical protein SAMN05660866_00668 [Maribacter arcticus]
MRKLAAFALVLFSCSNEDDFGLESTQFVFSEQKWELIQMTGNYKGSKTTGDDMAWQEYYVLNPAGTFEKSRTRDEVVTVANGTFEVVEFENDTEHYLLLTFESGEELVGNCGDGLNELLVYKSATKISSTWQACDGPGLDYVLSKN